MIAQYDQLNSLKDADEWMCLMVKDIPPGSKSMEEA